MKMAFGHQGDPWANAAAAGYVFPAYSGWGTKFKKRKATVVDSSRFLSKPKPVQVDERGFFENKELTKVHQRLHQNLKRATSQEPCVGTPLGCAVQIYIIYHIYYTYIYIYSYCILCINYSIFGIALVVFLANLPRRRRRS